MEHVKYIIIHHSLTKDSKTVSWDAIRKYHIGEMRWNDIGYNYGIELINNHYEILKGRPLFINGKFNPGAHTKGHNHESIGICCVGNYDIIQPDGMMLIKLLELIRDAGHLFHIRKGNIKGHRDFANKSCPGKLFDIEAIRRIV